MAQPSNRDAFLVAVTARLTRITNSGDVAFAGSPEAFEELAGLCAQIQPESDVQASQVAGLMFFCRSQAVADPDERARCFVEALIMLRAAYKTGHGVIPEVLAEILGANPAFFGPHWHIALATLSDRLFQSRSDDPASLSLPIALLRKAVGIQTNGSPARILYLSNLGMFLRLRHEMTNSESDLQEALATTRSCLDEGGPNAINRSRTLFNLSLAYRDQYRLTGADEDVEAWVQFARESLPNAEAKHRTTLVSNLVNALRVKHRNALSDGLDEIVDVTRHEIVTLPDASATGEMLDLSSALLTRFQIRGALQDLDEAISLIRRYLSNSDPTDNRRPGCLSNLGVALMMRYDVNRIRSDLEEGFEASREAVRIAPKNDPDYPMFNSNVCLVALTRAGRRQSDEEDIQLAISSGRAALKGTPRTDRRYAAHASNLAVALLSSSRSNPDLSDVDEAIALSREAVSTAKDFELVGLFETNVALGELARYRLTGSHNDLDDAIARCREALRSLSPETPVRADTLLTLSEALMERNAAGDPEERIIANQEAARFKSASLAKRFVAANNWAEAAAKRADWRSACEAYSEAIHIISFFALGSHSHRDQLLALANIDGLSSRAVAAHLELGDVEGAVEAFEHGRGVLVARELGTRAELRVLGQAYPALAQEYREARERLLALDNQDPPRTVDPGAVGASLIGRAAAIGRERASLQQRLDSLLGEIRALDGFHRFQSAAPVHDLYAAASNCPVVLLSATASRSDALIVTSVGVAVVPLPHLSPEHAEKQAKLLWGCIEDIRHDISGMGTHIFAEFMIAGVLSWLWDAVVEPVMTVLGITGKLRQEIDGPCICWCPSGFLSLLPLHAAGHHETRAADVPRVGMERAVSTYTPTLQALLSSPQRDTMPKPVELLVVAMPQTPGDVDLPGAGVEARFLRDLFGERTRLIGAVDGGSPATAENVIKVLPTSRWAHFACHAVADLGAPSSGGLLLDEGRDHLLSVRDLMQMDLDGVELAFLSACATARSSPVILDEILHLASGFRIAGYPHVVATLWEVNDLAAVFITKHFYQGLAERSNSTNAAAVCLHAAVRRLRDEFPDRPSMWAAHVHLGP